MQIGLVTMDGRQVGVVTWTEGEAGESPFDMPAEMAGPPGGATLQQGGREGGGHHHRHPAVRGGHIGRDSISDSGIETPKKPRYGGEGDIDAPPERKLNLPSTPDRGDRVYGRFADYRDHARRELEEKPWLNDKAMHIFAGENPHPEAATALWESAINRAAVRGTSLEQQLRRHASSGKDEGGYYAGYNSTVTPQVRKTLEDARDRALGYSNVSGYATDNSSGDLARREQATGSFLHRSEYNREHFFAPGSSQPVNRDRWRRMVEESERSKSLAKADKPADVTFDPETMAP